MKLVFLNGGLANQVFQYAFYRFAQLRHPEEDWVMDDSFFFVHDVHNGYELESVFGLKPNLLSQRFEPDVWDYMIELKRQGKSIPEILNENGMHFIMLAEYDNWMQWNPFSGQVQNIAPGKYLPELTDLQGDLYYHGYWLIPDYLKRNDGQVLRELHFIQQPSDNKVILEQEINSVNSVGIHIRRGDFASLGIDLPIEYYQDAVPEIRSRVGENPIFYVFSDDIDWCRQHMRSLGLSDSDHVDFVQPESEPEQAWQDLFLMSHCKNMILSNSSFCYLATLMNANLKEYRNPSQRNIFLGDMVYDVNRLGERLKKRCLINYTTAPFEMNLNETRHQNVWQSIALAYLLGKLGYIVDIRQYTDYQTEPEPGIYYDLLIDTHPDDNPAFQQHLRLGCKRIAYMTTANPTFNNRQEQIRLENFFQKKNIRIDQERYFAPISKSVESYDGFMCFGNQMVFDTYRSCFHLPPTFPIINHGYELDCAFDPTVKKANSFCFISSVGQVHKGLDILLDIFGQKDFPAELYICGLFNTEKQFCEGRL